MVAAVTAWYRRPGFALKAAILTTLIAIAFLAPRYLHGLWPAAQNALAPWWIAMVREPFFAKIMFFDYYPAYPALMIVAWVLAVGLWVFALLDWRRSRAAKSAAAKPSMELSHIAQGARS